MTGLKQYVGKTIRVWCQTVTGASMTVVGTLSREPGPDSTRWVVSSPYSRAVFRNYDVVEVTEGVEPIIRLKGEDRMTRAQQTRNLLH